MFYAQEGLAQRANPQLQWFVEFPQAVLVPALMVGLLAVAGLAVGLLTAVHRGRVAVWMLAVSALSVVGIIIILLVIGPAATLTIINPNW